MTCDTKHPAMAVEAKLSAVAPVAIVSVPLGKSLSGPRRKNVEDLADDSGIEVM